MRFEALNQVFKQIAVGGSYRDTPKRCAEFWCMRSARLRQKASTGVAVRSSDLLTHRRGDASMPAMAAYLFTLPQYSAVDELSVEMLPELAQATFGATVSAGETWIEIDGKLAFVRALDGIMSVNGEVVLCLTYYPSLQFARIFAHVERSVLRLLSLVLSHTILGNLQLQ